MREAKAKSDVIHAMLSPVVKALGYKLWGIEYYPKGRGRILRIFIDSDNGISVDDCVAVSNQVGALLDVENVISEEYELEISSPGFDRRLFCKDQYPAFIGEKVDFRLRTPFQGKKKYVGRLSEVKENEVVVLVGDHEFRLPFDMLDRVRIQPSD